MTVSFQNSSFTSGTSTTSTNLLSGGVSSSSLYNTDYLDSKYEYNDTKESYEIAETGRDTAIESYISNFMTYLESGQEDKAMEAYESLLEEMSEQTRYSQLIGDDGDDTQLRSVAKELIEEELGEDVSLEDYINGYARSNIGVERQTMLWGADNCDQTSREDLLNETCNLDIQETHTNIFGKAIYGTIGIFTKIGQSIFGNGEKH